MRPIVGGLVAGVALLAPLAGSAGAGAAPAPPPMLPVVLVLVPDLTWANAPTSLDGYAKANLSMRSARARTAATDGYLSIGKGAPAAFPRELEPLRMAPGPGSGLVLADWDRVRAYDDSLRQPGDLGRLADALDRAGRRWATVAVDREVVAATADTRGGVGVAYAGGAEGVARALSDGADAVVVGTPLGQLLPVLDAAASTCTVVASVSTPEGSRHLGALATSPACGLGGGGLASASTHHDHLATLMEVGPTFLGRAGIARPPSFAATTVTSAPDVSRAALVARDRRAYAADRARSPLVWLFVALTLVGAIAVAVSRRARVPVTYGLLAIPAASFLMMVVPWWRAGLAGAVVTGSVLCAVLAVGAAAAGRTDVTLGVGALALTAAAVVGIDAIFGGPLEIDAPFGNSPVTGARFFGVGNIGSGFLAAGLLVGGGIALDRLGARAWPGVAAAFAAGVIVGGAPWFGADVGGALAYVPAYALLLLGWRRGRPTLRQLLFAAGLALAVVAGFALLDALRPGAVQSHLGRAVGGDTLIDQVLRKADRALNTIRSPMALLILIGGLALVAVRPRFEGRPALRATGWALLVAGIAGTALNDSGLVVGAAVMAIAWPTFVALATAPAPPALRPAPPADRVRASAPVGQ